MQGQRKKDRRDDASSTLAAHQNIVQLAEQAQQVEDAQARPGPVVTVISGFGKAGDGKYAGGQGRKSAGTRTLDVDYVDVGARYTIHTEQV